MAMAATCAFFSFLYGSFVVLLNGLHMNVDYKLRNEGFGGFDHRTAMSDVVSLEMSNVSYTLIASVFGGTLAVTATRMEFLREDVFGRDGKGGAGARAILVIGLCVTFVALCDAIAGGIGGAFHALRPHVPLPPYAPEARFSLLGIGLLAIASSLLVARARLEGSWQSRMSCAEDSGASRLGAFASIWVATEIFGIALFSSLLAWVLAYGPLVAFGAGRIENALAAPGGFPFRLPGSWIALLLGLDCARAYVLSAGICLAIALSCIRMLTVPKRAGEALPEAGRQDPGLDAIA